MFKKTRSLWLIFGLAALLATFITAGAASQPAQLPQPEVIYRGLLQVVHFDVSPRLDTLPTAEFNPQVENEIFDDRDTGLEGSLGPQDADGALQDFFGDGLIPSPLVSFNGPASTGSTPPDPVGDIGPSHYVAMSNLSYAVYSRTGTVLLGPLLNKTLWAGFGGNCETRNDGDPVVVYDQLVDRWILTQFTASGPTYFECLAISTTGDPTGSFFRYAISTGTNFPDYPKVGVWSDAYYVSTREFAGSPFAGVGAYALNKADVISGDPTPTIISFLVPPGGTPYNVGDGLLPADLDGTTLPPSSTTYFVGSMDNGGPYGAPSDNLTLWKFTPNWTTPASSTFVLANTIPVAAFDSMLSICSGRACIPQPSTTVKIDHLGYRQRPTFRLAYRNFGTHESLVTSQSVEATAGISGMRWWEIRSPGSSPTIFQQGTYAPGDGIHRWMGSIAQDQDGNMALGYSVSNSSVFPGVRYTGRLVGDPLGTMPQGEGTIITGTGSQTSTFFRWGDYSSMNVDPLDDCTFWYVNQWVPTTSSTGWVLRIGSFVFPGCGTGGPTPTPTGSATVTPTATPTKTPTPTPTKTATPGTGYKIYLPLVTHDTSTGGGTPVEITHSSSQAITPLNSVACGDGTTTTDNQFLRHFDLDAFSLTSGLDVTDVEFAVESVNLAALNVTVNLYNWNGVTFTYPNLTLIGTASQVVGTGASGTIVSFPVTGSVPAGDWLVVEVKTPDTTGVSGFWIGSNTASESAASYLASTTCGLPNPASTASIGFPGMHIVINVLGLDPALNGVPVNLTLDGYSTVAGDGDTVSAPLCAAGSSGMCYNHR